MRDDHHIRRKVALLAVFVWAFALSCPAAAQSLRGYTQIQYQKLDNPGAALDREIWLSAVQLDLTKRFEDRLDLSAQFLFRGVNYAGRPEKTQTPRGTLRLTHRYFGAMGSFRPVQTTDALGFTSRVDETQLSAYTAHERWPTVTATWLRRVSRPSDGQATSTGTARTLMASYDLGLKFQVHGGYSDQGRVGEQGEVRSNQWRNWTGGAATQLGSARAHIGAQYDATDSRNFVQGALTERSLIQSVSVNGGAIQSRQLTSSLAYTFRRTQGENSSSYTLDDHEGLALERFAWTRAISFSGGGGVRSIRTLAGRDVESYLVFTGSAEGPIRPGWMGSAGVSRSWNWIGASQPRPIDTYQASTRMRLADGLDVTAAGQVNVTDTGVNVQVDSLGRAAGVVSQGTATITARPLRPFLATYSLRTYRAGSSLTEDVSKSNSDQLDARWNPSGAFQVWGSIARTHGVGVNAPRLLVRQANAQWTPSKRLEIAGNWWRSDESRVGPTPGLAPGGRETYAGRILLGLTRNLRTILIVSSVDPGRPTHSMQIEATANLGFGK